MRHAKEMATASILLNVGKDVTSLLIDFHRDRAPVMKCDEAMDDVEG
jgi:hypothetical protein